MNTRIEYMYRDACNYKTFRDVVVTANLAMAELEPYYHEGTFFIPSVVGLQDLQAEPFTVDDHIWHEIRWMVPTSDEPTVEIEADELITRFRAASLRGWDEYLVLKRKGF